MQLQYAPLDAYRQADKLSKWERLGAYAALNRLNALFMIQKAGSGHIGSSFSSMDIITYMHLEHPEIAFFSSKGHDAPAFYASLIATGKIPFEMLFTLRRLGGLPGHPELKTPSIVAHSGSLGMGISKAKGLIRANSLKGIQQRVCVLLGDGELQEGQVWESLMDADLAELTVIIDANQMSTERPTDMQDLCNKLGEFALTYSVDGHAYKKLASIIDVAHINATILLAITTKGKGVSFMEGQPQYHSGALTVDEYQAATDELHATIWRYLPDYWFGQHCIPAPKPRKNELMAAYEACLYSEAFVSRNFVVLSADLAHDCGLVKFRQAFPDRFIECGIAEQDMVSQAGMLAASGFVPIVHSFAAFLTRRACEQIYDNSSQPGLRVVYVGSLAGRLPDGPGSSHEALQDIALMQTMPNMEILEPLTVEEVDIALKYAVNQAEGSVYLRLVANPIERMRVT